MNAKISIVKSSDPTVSKSSDRSLQKVFAAKVGTWRKLASKLPQKYSRYSHLPI